MEYRRLGRTGLSVSAIGIGTEFIEGGRDGWHEVLETGVEAGVSFVDVLPSGVKGWQIIGPIAREMHEHLVLALHWGPDRDLDLNQRRIDNMLRWLGDSPPEVLFLTVVDTDEQYEWALESAERLRPYLERGDVRHLGLSGHTQPTAVRAIEDGLIDVVMLPINMQDLGLTTDHSLHGVRPEHREPLYHACREHDVGLVAMKPYGRAKLFWREPSATPVQCLEYVMRQPVATTVPGVRSAEELRGALTYYGASEAERDYSGLIDGLRARPPGQCIYGNHCQPCTAGIDIAQVMLLLDLAKEQGNSAEFQARYDALPIKASACTGCWECMERCPYDVYVIGRMKEAVALYE